jgi:hypothetical protein
VVGRPKSHEAGRSVEMMWLVELVSSHTIVGCRKQNGPPSDRKMRVISDECNPPITSLLTVIDHAGPVSDHANPVIDH